MNTDPGHIAADFNARSANYAKNLWHRDYAEGLVAHSAIAAGDRVLDAGVGTGFAALAAARRVGPAGAVVGLDVSAGMLVQARAAIDDARLTNVDLARGDACDLRQFADASFDAVICSAALLYMPVERALGEWLRVLKPDGSIGFSTMKEGFPRAGQLFRDCASAFGVTVTDPSTALGSEAASRASLERAGFVDVHVVADRVTFSDGDLACAWESNLRSSAHEAVRSLPTPRLEALRAGYETALAEARQADPAFGVADVFYVYGRKPGPRSDGRQA
jgi:ubiquinone/menaquinone biosynthesis C-methylase UbiE